MVFTFSTSTFSFGAEIFHLFGFNWSWDTKNLSICYGWNYIHELFGVQLIFDHSSNELHVVNSLSGLKCESFQLKLLSHYHKTNNSVCIQMKRFHSNVASSVLLRTYEIILRLDFFSDSPIWRNQPIGVHIALIRQNKCMATINS